ncbi:MAG: hypothetical protein NTV98_04985, partial [Candidatus Roizmanbacteria bacterium]|nr:hypothetical protein [Candidatus Roizmanbacteria bacterium]
ARRNTDIEQIRAAVELYRSFKGSYPVPPLSFGTGSLKDGTTVYMSTVPKDPMSTSPTQNTYYYTSSGTFQDYTLCAYIEGGDTSVSISSCGNGIICNYCMGPYGQK